MAVPASRATRVSIIAMSVLALTTTACSSSAAESSGDQPGQVGNVIFLHPDGTGLNSWGVARAYWKGPDGALAWDELPEMAAYRGHMEDVATGTSNGGATTHAFGYKVDGPGSFGKDGDGDAQPPTDRFINSLSGYPGSVMREAANNGHPVGIVNDGMIAEPGTGAFLAEVSSRDDTTGISQQILLGRPNTTDTAPQVILGGGETDFLPENTPRCAPEAITLDCRVHEVAEGDGTTTTGRRTDGQNLLRVAEQRGYTVLRTRGEFEQLRDRVAAEADFAPKVLGLFAAVDTFNDVPEEALIANGFVDPAIPAEDRRSNLILFGDKPGTPGYNPPTVADMSELATTILGRVSAGAGKPFFLVTEPESTDNLGNNNNAIGSLTAMARADDVIARTRRFIADNPNTLLITAADSDGGGIQAVGYEPSEVPAAVETGDTNPVGVDDGGATAAPLDGLYGHNSKPFTTAADQFGRQLPFAVQWTGTADVTGGVLTRAEGLNAALLRTEFSRRFDNIDIYRITSRTLFARNLPYPDNRPAPAR